jgi:hypothetical protein
VKCYYTARLLLGTIELVLVVPQLVPVLHLEERLSVGDTELGDHHTRSEHRPVQPDVVVVGPLKDPPVLEVAVKGLVARPRHQLHPEISPGITVIVEALDLVGVPHVAVVSLNAFAWQEVAGEGVEEDLDVRPGTGGVRPFHPNKIALQDINPELVLERGLARILVGTEGVPLLGDPLLLDAEVGAIDCHKTIIQLVIDKTTVEINL